MEPHRNSENPQPSFNQDDILMIANEFFTWGSALGHRYANKTCGDIIMGIASGLGAVIGALPRSGADLAYTYALCQLVQVQIEQCCNMQVQEYVERN